MAGIEGEALLVDVLLDGGRDGGRQRQAAAHGLGQAHDVGRDAEEIRRRAVTDAAERGLRLVEDQQHAALVGRAAQRLHIRLRWHQHAAGADHRLDDDGGGAAGAGHVEHLQADLQAGQGRSLGVHALDIGAIHVRFRHDVDAGHVHAVALAVAGVGHAADAAGHAVPGSADRQDLVALGVHLGHAQGYFIAFGAGVDEDGLGQAGRHPVARQRGGQPRDHLGNHAAEQVEGVLARQPDRLDDGRVVVADGGAHLAGGEIQDLRPVSSRTTVPRAERNRLGKVSPP